MKTEVYTWRVSSELKTSLEREARRQKLSMSAALGLATREWLDKSGVSSEEEAEQARLRRAASRCLGSITGSDPHRSEKVSETVRENLRQRYGR